MPNVTPPTVSSTKGASTIVLYIGKFEPETSPPNVLFLGGFVLKTLYLVSCDSIDGTSAEDLSNNFNWLTASLNDSANEFPNTSVDDSSFFCYSIYSKLLEEDNFEVVVLKSIESPLVPSIPAPEYLA